MSEGKPEKKPPSWDEKPLGVRLSVERRSQLEALAVKAGKSLKEYLEELVDIAHAFDIPLEGWKKRVLHDILDNLELRKEYQKDLAQFGVELRKEASKELKAMELLKSLLFKYLDTLEIGERRQLLEQTLSGILVGGSIDIASLANYRMVKVNGRLTLVKFNEAGKPETSLKLIPCEEGYHIPDTSCKCNKWRECKLRINERVEYKLKKTIV